jgi:ribonuclease HII
MLASERTLWARGLLRIAGIDEAGRGPLAGPVVAAAVIISPGTYISGVNDSKLLSETEREDLFERITRLALAVGVGVVDHTTIDAINILNATYRAMEIAVRKLAVSPDHLLIDGNRFVWPTAPDNGTPVPFSTIVDGDALCFSIAAASIIAKVTRDRMMVEYDRQFPGYGFARHKGYATPEHREAINTLGYCDIHRRSFSIRTQLPLPFDDAEEAQHTFKG